MIDVSIQGVSEQFSGHTLEQFNTEVCAWASKVNQEVKTSLQSQTQNSTRLQKSIKFSFKKTHGEIRRLNLNFDRRAIYVHSGASRGHGGCTGSRWRTSIGMEKNTNLKSLGRMGKGNRPAKPFIEPALNSNIDELADIVANYCADMCVKVYTINF